MPMVKGDIVLFQTLAGKRVKYHQKLSHSPQKMNKKAPPNLFFTSLLFLAFTRNTRTTGKLWFLSPTLLRHFYSFLWVFLIYIAEKKRRKTVWVRDLLLP
jgi:hypothetical protein